MPDKMRPLLRCSFEVRCCKRNATRIVNEHGPRKRQELAISMSNDNEADLLRAGIEYQAILDQLRKQQHDYRRLLLDIGVREQRLPCAGGRAIELPDLPSIESHETAIAEKLMTIADTMVHRHGRIAPYLEREKLTSLVPLISRLSEFSPARLAEELADELLGERGGMRIRHQAALQLRKHFGPHLNLGAAMCLTVLQQPVRNEKGRMLDSLSSQRLAEWLQCFAEVIQQRGNMTLRAQVDDMVEEIDSIGRATIETRHTLEHDGDTVRFGLRKDMLRVYLSEPLMESLRAFVGEHCELRERVSNGAWFRAVAEPCRT